MPAPSTLALARRLWRTNPTTAPGLPRARFNHGNLLEPGPNCYSYAMGDWTQRLMPGWPAAQRRDERATGPGETPAEQRDMFQLDGLIPLHADDLRSLPHGSWVVSLHQRVDGDFHLRRLDVTGWSEKRGDHPVETFTPRHWVGLLRARSEEGPYTFAGFWRVEP